MNVIYLDNNATTPLLPEVREALLPYFSHDYGNPASSHSVGRSARRALEQSRELTAHLLGASPNEVLFTSGATEANNLALFGLVEPPPSSLLLSPVEHPCVSEPAKHLAKSGHDLTFLDVDAVGTVIPESLKEHLAADTGLLAVMLANHETGVVQPITELRQLLPESIPFHCDAAAAAGKMPIDFHELGLTSLTISAHKFHGPKGVGALLVRQGSRLHPQQFGGHQQQGKRPGTEPVALAVGLAKALELAVRDITKRTEHVTRLRQLFWERLQNSAAPVIWNGHESGLPYTMNVSFPGCRADVLLMNLDLVGVACSTGSACSSGSLLPSPVLQAMRVSDDALQSAMRFSFSALLSEADVLEAARRIADVVERLRMEGKEEDY